MSIKIITKSRLLNPTIDPIKPHFYTDKKNVKL